MNYATKGLCKQSEIALHTHDSISYKRCRRKWFFSSPFQRHLQPKASAGGANKNLWFGSGFHFAMEDYHGHNKFGSPMAAFEAYVAAFAPEELPIEVDELVPLGDGMLSYYQEWERTHAKWKTVWLDGKPLVEVSFSLVLDPLCHYLAESGHRYYRSTEEFWESPTEDGKYTVAEMQAEQMEYVEIVFHGTIDRVVEDENGDWWVLDYKTAKVIDTAKLNLDPQISKYCWAAEQWLQHEIEGMVYIQCSKNPPKAPKTTTKGISTDKRQRTTHTLYRNALIDFYGDVQAAPAGCIELLNNLADVETENGNAFIRYDWVARNEASKINTYRHIIEEGLEILNPRLDIYHNPTKDCAWDCPFKDMCLAMEEGADWEFYLDEFEVRNETMNDEIPRWQRRMITKHKDLFPEEFQQYCTVNVDSIEAFGAKYNEEKEIKQLFDKIEE